jgi:hypothetical protein
MLMLGAASESDDGNESDGGGNESDGGGNESDDGCGGNGNDDWTNEALLRGKNQ